MRVIAMIFALMALTAAGGCSSAPASRQATSVHAVAASHEVTASADGVDLSVKLSPAGASGSSRYELRFSVSAPGSDPVEVKSPNGSLVDIQMKSLGTSSVVFQSLKLDQEAIASQPAGFKPDSSQSLSEGDSQSSTYRFSLPAGRYLLTARTFEPVVAIKPTEIAIP